MLFRRLLLIYPIHATRYLLKNYILGELPDLKISDVDDIAAADSLLRSESFDVIVVSSQSDVRDLRNLGDDLPIIVLAEKESVVMQNDKPINGFYRVVELRKRPMDIIHSINDACNPRHRRKAPRYHIPNTGVLIHNGNLSVRGTVINISTGGMLVELTIDNASLILAGALSITLNIAEHEGCSEIGELNCKLLRMEILKWKENYEPSHLYATFVFVNLSNHFLKKLSDCIERGKVDIYPNHELSY
jgi:hypothetical protein